MTLDIKNIDDVLKSRGYTCIDDYVYKNYPVHRDGVITNHLFPHSKIEDFLKSHPIKDLMDDSTNYELHLIKRTETIIIPLSDGYKLTTFDDIKKQVEKYYPAGDGSLNDIIRIDIYEKTTELEHGYLPKKPKLIGTASFKNWKQIGSCSC
jgi:hypothetical protein